MSTFLASSIRNRRARAPVVRHARNRSGAALADDHVCRSVDDLQVLNALERTDCSAREPTPFGALAQLRQALNMTLREIKARRGRPPFITPQSTNVRRRFATEIKSFSRHPVDLWSQIGFGCAVMGCRHTELLHPRYERVLFRPNLAAAPSRPPTNPLVRRRVATM